MGAQRGAGAAFSSSEQSPGHQESMGGRKTQLSALRTLLVVVVSFCSDELEKFMESQGAASPGILILTTSLSKPFLRLDKYVTLLQELERHMEVGGVWGCWAGSALWCCQSWSLSFKRHLCLLEFEHHVAKSAYHICRDPRHAPDISHLSD